MDKIRKRRFEPLLTAQEAFPAFEREVLAAEQDIIAGFRIFDPDTKLRSDAAKQIGATWCDLITHTLDKGVRIKLTISDFDPVVRLNSHIYTHDCLHRLSEVAEASRNPELFEAQAAMHPARVGLLPRLILWPRLLKEIRDELADINTKSREEKDAFLRSAPALRPLVRWKGDTLVPRAFPPPPLVPVTHHQKLAVFDKKRLYIGGLDLNDRRYDTLQHDQGAEDTWHDAQVIVDGPVAREAAEHLAHYQAEINGADPRPTKLLLRTLSAKRKVNLPFMSPRKVVQGLAEAHRRQIDQSETLIYLESQFFRDRSLAKYLARRAQQVPGLCLILILPLAPEDAAFQDEPGSDVAYGEYLQSKCIDIVRDAFGPRVFIGSPLQPRAVRSDDRKTDFDAPLVYLHAKVSIFDDRCAIISSANLNGRSLGWDTEAGIATQTTEEVAQLKQRCFSHWLGPDADPAAYESRTACDAWAAHAAQNAKRRPAERQGFILPHSAGEAAASGYNLPGVPDEMV